MEAEHTSFFWPEVDDLLTYEFSADLMDQLHAGLQGGAPADAPPPPAPSFPPAVGGPPMPDPGALTMPAPSGGQPMPLSGPNPFLPGPAEQPTVPAADFGLPAAAAAMPPVPDLKLSSPIVSDSDPTIRTSEVAGFAPPPQADVPRSDSPAPGAGYVPDVVAGSFGSEMAPPPPAGPPAAPPSDGTAGLDGLRGSRLFDPRPEPPDAGSGRLKLGNLFEPTDPGGPPQTRRLVRLAGRQSPDEVDVTSARLVSPFDSSGPSVRSLFPSAPPGDRPARSPFLDDGFGPGAAHAEQRMGSPAPFGPDAGPFGQPDGGTPWPPVSLSHSTVVDPASGPPVGASFLAPAPSDAWSSGNPAWTNVSDTVSDLPPRQGQGFLYLEDDADPWAGPQVMRQADAAGRDKGAMLDSVLDVLDRKRGALLAGALALTAVLGGLLAYSKLAGGDGTEASGSFTAVTSTSTASSVSSATGESSSGAGVSVAGPTTILDSETTVAPSSAATDASSTSTTRKKATTSSGSTATTAAPTDPTTVTTQPPTSPTTQPATTSTTRATTTSTTRATTTSTTRATTTSTTRATTTSTTQPSTTPSTPAPTDPPTTPSTSGSSATPAIATP